MNDRRKPRGRPVPPRAPLDPGGLYILEIQHDDLCPTLSTGDFDLCTCEEVIEKITRWQDRGQS